MFLKSCISVRAATISIVLLGLLMIFSTIPTVSSYSRANQQPLFSNPVNLSNDTAKAMYPNVQSVGSHVYVAWTEQSGGIKFRESSDKGKAWNPTITISPPVGTTQYPMISANGSNVYVVWSQTVEKTGNQLLFASSSNYGASFNSAIQISPKNSSDNYITPVIASQGINVYVAFIDNQNAYSYVVASSNNGLNWTKPFLVSTYHEPQVYAWGDNAYVISDYGLAMTHNNGSSWTMPKIKGCCGHEPWIWGFGSNVYGVWETKNQSKVYVIVSNNNGKSWKGPTFLTTTLRDSWTPIVGAYGNSAWVAEREYPGGSKGQVWVYTTANGGKNWSSPISLSGKGAKGSAETFPFTISSSDGKNVFVTWSQQISTGYWVLRVSYSSNGGTSWTAPPGIDVSQNKNGEAGTETDIPTAAISSYGTHCYATWEYMNGTSNQIYFAHS